MTLPFPTYFLVPSSILVLTVGFYSFLKGRGKENLVFFLLTITQSIWALSTFLMYENCGDDSIVIFWDKIIYFFVSFLIALLFHLSLEICGLTRTKVNKILLPAAYGIGSILAYLATTDYLVGGVFDYQWGCHTLARTGHHFFVAYLLFFVSLAIYNLFLTWRKETDRIKKNRLLYAFLAFFIFSLDGIASVQAYGIGIYPWYYLFFPVFSIVITYATTEKNLHASVIATDTLVAFILILVSTFFFFPDIDLGFWGKAFIFLLLLWFCILLVKATESESRRRESAEAVLVQERSLRAEAEKIAADLKRLDAAKTQFMLSTQHHLRSPLTIVQGYLSMIGEGAYGKINAKVSEKVSVALQETQKLIKMVNDLLDMAKNNMNLEGGAKESVDMSLIIRGVINDLAQNAKNRGLFLTFVDTGKIMAVPAINSNAIGEAIYNLVDNAIKYTEQGGVTIKMSQIDNAIRISISDTGIGLDQKDRRGLFSRTFERGEKAKKINTIGKGIGLYLASQMIYNNNGKIWVESAGRGKGSTFFVEFPILPSLSSLPVVPLTPGSRANAAEPALGTQIDSAGTVLPAVSVAAKKRSANVSNQTVSPGASKKAANPEQEPSSPL